MKISNITILIIAFASITSHAQERFTYKGIKLGASIDEFQAALPYYRCAANTCTYLLDSCAPFPSTGSSDDVTKRFSECLDGTSYGGERINYGRASFIDGKLARIYLTSSEMDLIDNALLEKYGKPASVDNTPVINKMGTKFSNWVKTWKSGTERLVVSQRADKIDEGYIAIFGSAAINDHRSRMKEQAKRGAKDF